MRSTLAFALFLLVSVAYAQPDRYELGRKVHDLEVTWEKMPPSAEAKKRATPLINQAVQSFFRFNMSAAAKFIDEARHALLSAEAVPDSVKWADAICLQPETRLIDASQPEWTVVAKHFYKPDAEKQYKISIRLTVGDGKSQEVKLEKLPATLHVTVKDIPGGNTADHKVKAEILSNGKVVVEKWLALSRIENLEKRLEALKKFADRKSEMSTIEQTTQAHLSKLLNDLAAKTTPETDYPAAKLLAEVETLAGNSKTYFDHKISGENWISLNTSKGNTVVRALLPEKMNPESALPVVVALHGMGGSENMYFDAYGNGIIPRLASERGWIVIGTRVGGFLGAGAAPDVQGILEQLSKRFPIDRKKVFLIGHSMGAGHAMLLSQQSPKNFAGVAALGGGGKIGKPDSVKELPFFIGCGKQDFALRGAKLMNDSLTAVKAPVKFKEYDDIEHLAIVQEAAKDVFEFFDGIAKHGK